MTTDATRTSVLRSTLTLVFFAIIASAVVAVTWVNTKQRIADNNEAARVARFAAVLGAVTFDTIDTDKPHVIPTPHTLPGNAPVTYVTVRRADAIVAWVFRITAKGYSGPIQMMIGVTTDVRISGVRVITHSETPGLGDDIERSKSDWIESFNGMQVRGETDTQWALKRDGGSFDGFTGASITPRAVIQAVAQTLRWAERHQDTLRETTP
ncbi:MAG: RnfABCDGE type electron transport complex subunit G [Pseudomonadota bacterium]